MTSDLFGPELVNFIIGPHVIPALRPLVSGESKLSLGHVFMNICCISYYFFVIYELYYVLNFV